MTCFLRTQATLANIVVLIAWAYVAPAFGQNNTTGGAIVYTLWMERGPYVAGEPVPCQLQIQNKGNTMCAIPRPLADNVTLVAVGPDGKPYRATWQKQERGYTGAREVALAAKCTLQMRLGEFTMVADEGGQAEIPFGRYVISGAWAMSEGRKTPLVEPLGKVFIDIVEYPLQVMLTSSKYFSFADDPMMVTISLQNKGQHSVSLLNYFHPIEDYFILSVTKQNDVGKADAANAGIRETHRELRAVTPDADTGWVTLLPRETLCMDFNIAQYLKEEGEYVVSVAYPRRLLLRHPEAQPKYTKQSRWESCEVTIRVLTKTR